MAVITISRQYGAGGQTLGRLLADRLSYTFADSGTIQRFAREINSPAGRPVSFGRKAGQRITQLAATFPENKATSGQPGDRNGQMFLEHLVLIIAQIADEGNAVIMGRGSQYILADHPDTRHVLLINTVENRIRFLMKKNDLPERQATRQVQDEDLRRADLYRKLGKQDYDHPALYHLVLNMARMDLPTALDLMVHLTRS